MSEKNKAAAKKRSGGPSLFGLLANYKPLVTLLITFAILTNAFNLWLPKIIAGGIDAFGEGNFNPKVVVIEFLVATLVIFVFAWLQNWVQTVVSERVARDLRNRLADKISRQSYAYIIKSNPSKLLTNLTSDIDSIKLFVSHAFVSIISSVFVIIGAMVLLLMTNWKLALPIIAIIPVIGIAFYMVLIKVRVLIKKSREVIDRLNKVINESILGAAIIRVLNAQQTEAHKFLHINSQARDLGISILMLFATLMPIITFTANLAILTILAFGGHLVITDNMSLGDFAAFNSYLTILIFPIIIIGFMSSLIAQASASFKRINEVLSAHEPKSEGIVKTQLSGRIRLDNVQLLFGEKAAIKNLTIEITPGSKTAIVGPTAAGKTQLLYLLTGLATANNGTIAFDGTPIGDFEAEAFYRQVGLVFQDSVMFNMSVRENVAFSDDISPDDLKRAIDTAELSDFLDALPNGINTIISERGTSLSGGQKQRIMLARALALNPRILLLDDFTARVDSRTEQKIVDNLQRHYPDLTLISVTQKIAPIVNYDQIAVLMEGELVAKGTHQTLMASCPEYVQIFNSQRSTNAYEL
jgi:ATP-binding cassette, subfamily B, bacterial